MSETYDDDGRLYPCQCGMEDDCTRDCEIQVNMERDAEVEERIAGWLSSTCDDEDGHTCNPCFQGNGMACEFKPLAEMIENKEYDK